MRQSYKLQNATFVVYFTLGDATHALHFLYFLVVKNVKSALSVLLGKEQ
jgi:hypothetical protein